MARTRRVRVLPVGGLVGLLLGAVVVPAILSIALGVLALALSQKTFDIVVGVLILCFAVSAITGGFVAFALLNRAARLALMQSDFVANVSHELRTPVAGIRLLAETLTMGRAAGEDKSREVGTLILNEAQRLQDLVERILRWRRLEAGALQLDMAVQPLAPILEEVVQSFRASEEDTMIALHLDPVLPPVYVDRAAMTDVVRNLVENAVKFGGEAGPVEVVARPGDGDVLLEVRDRGPGIPKHERKRVFQRFYRVPVHPHAKQGTGIGLSIAHSIVRAHKGRIGVASEPGIGSTFTVRIPAAIEEIPDLGAARQAQAYGAKAGNN